MGGLVPSYAPKGTFSDTKLHNSLGATVSSSSGDFGPREEVYWSIGWEQLNREVRHQTCSSFAAQRMEALAGSVVDVILESSMASEIGPLQVRKSVSHTLNMLVTYCAFFIAYMPYSDSLDRYESC